MTTDVLTRLRLLCKTYKAGGTANVDADQLSSDLTDFHCLLEAYKEREDQAHEELQSLDPDGPQARATRNAISEVRSRSSFVALVATAHWRSSSMRCSLPAIVQRLMIGLDAANTLDRLSSQESIVTLTPSDESYWPIVSVRNRSDVVEEASRREEKRLWAAMIARSALDKDGFKERRARGSRRHVVESGSVAKRQRTR